MFSISCFEQIIEAIPLHYWGEVANYAKQKFVTFCKKSYFVISKTISATLMMVQGIFPLICIWVYTVYFCGNVFVFVVFALMFCKIQMHVLSVVRRADIG